VNTTLCFTTPTVIRPDILRETYSSFQENLGVDFKQFTLFLNIDNVAVSTNYTYEDVVAVAEQFFGKVKANLTNSPSFPLAVKWLWSQVADYKYTFHLEDDWLMLRKVNLDDMITALEAAKHKSGPVWQCRLPKVNSANQPAVCMTPSVLRSDLIYAMVKSFHGDGDPEKQLCRHLINTYGTHLLAVIYPNKKGIVKDNGADWRAERGLLKPRDIGFSKDKFTHWVYSDGKPAG